MTGAAKRKAEEDCSKRDALAIRPSQVPVMEFRSSIGPAIVRSVSKPAPAPRMVTVP